MAAALLIQASPSPATQDTTGRPCRVAVDSMGHYAEIPHRDGTKTLHGGGGVLAHCDGTNTTISADSFAHHGALGRLDLIGRVQIRDTGMALDARLASYYLREERLEAHNNVVAVNRRNGSVLRGPNLRYLRAAKGIRDTVEMYATQRPTVEYRQAAPGDTARGQPEPYIIVADRMRFKGDDRMWAGGKATIDRSDFAARSDSMMLDQTRGLGVLVRGKPIVEGKGRQAAGEAAKSYTLVGTRIELALERRDVRAVKAMGDGKATGSDWTLTGDTIDLHISNRMLQQTFAWGDSLRPHAISTLYTIQSDSMAIDSPDEVLTESRAFGEAFSTARRDSTATAAETDWITGDTLTARFVQVQDRASNRPRTRLRQIVSHGSARALTHHPENRDTTAAAGDSGGAGGGSSQPAINYSRGQQIDITLLADRIDRVIVAGKADGVHLEPRPAVVVDSLKRAGADTTRSVAPAPPAPPPPPARRPSGTP